MHMANNRQPLLSIVIPTKDRYPYLKKLLELIISFESDDIEVIIQDNTAENSEILDFLKCQSNEHIKYFHTKTQIPISLNSDLAIKNSTGKFVSFIGDDDGVCKSILPCVHWMQENNIEVVVPSMINYNWPDSYTANKLLDEKGLLTYTPFSGRITMADPEKKLYELMQRGFTYRGELPLVYHGIVKRETLDKIFNIGGTYFPGNSPDIANGVSLSLVAKSYAQVDMPIIISGASAHHGGGVRKMKNRAARIEDIPFLLTNASENWDIRVPKVWSGVTVWADSALSALKYMGRDDLTKEVNYEYLYEKFITFSFGLRRLAYCLSSNKLKLFFKSTLSIITRYYNALKRVVYIQLNIKNKETERITGLRDIISAVRHFDNYTFEWNSIKEHVK